MTSPGWKARRIHRRPLLIIAGLPSSPGGDGIGWYTTRTLPPDAQICISESERTDKVADLSVTPETADLVWCVQTPNQTWFARRDGTSYFTGNTIQWATVGTIVSPNGVVFNISV